MRNSVLAVSIILTFAAGKKGEPDHAAAFGLHMQRGDQAWHQAVKQVKNILLCVHLPSLPTLFCGPSAPYHCDFLGCSGPLPETVASSIFNPFSEPLPSQIEL